MKLKLVLSLLGMMELLNSFHTFEGDICIVLV